MDNDIETMVAEIEARAEKATPGPWDVQTVFGVQSVMAESSCYDHSEAIAGRYGVHDANGDFIAHARQDVPELCTMLREAIAERDALRADATLWRNGMKALDELRATVIPCGHTIGDLIGGHGAVTKCGACLASIREHRATLATRLKAAIRRQTVDVDDGNAPNGPVEQAIQDIEKAVSPKAFYRDPDGARRRICTVMAAMCKHMFNDVKELREAADAYFGEDFTRPPPPTQP